jgi:hypothetical protein
MATNKESSVRELEPRPQKISLELTAEDLRILLSLASDALFREQFIDTRMPGFQLNTERLQHSKNLVTRLQQILHDHRAVAPERKPKPRRGPELQVASGGKRA